MSDISIIGKIKASLTHPLPGRTAQFRMAPSFRISMKESEAGQRAGVIILLYFQNNELFFPLIQRPEYNGAHSGQISFPGGKEDNEDQDIVDTALRECFEEIGISGKSIEVLGALTELYIPVSRYKVYPIVGFLKEPPVFKPDSQEVVSIIETPVSTLLNTATKKNKEVVYQGEEGTIPYFDIEGHMVWGATAMILSEFIEIWNKAADLL